jgi:Phospholipase_D-nuclease N-terminal
MLWFFLWIIWIWLLIVVLTDIFRSHDQSGWGKALWTIFVIVLPYLGVFVYLIARGGKMHEHSVQRAQAQDDAARSYIQSVAGTGPSAADEISRLADLRPRVSFRRPISRPASRRHSPPADPTRSAPSRDRRGVCHQLRRGFI